MNNVPDLEFLTGWHTVLYFVTLFLGLTSIYSNTKKGKTRMAFANIVFTLVLCYLYLSKYYMLK